MAPHSLRASTGEETARRPPSGPPARQRAASLRPLARLAQAAGPASWTVRTTAAPPRAAGQPSLKELRCESSVESSGKESEDKVCGSRNRSGDEFYDESITHTHGRRRSMCAPPAVPWQCLGVRLQQRTAPFERAQRSVLHVGAVHPCQLSASGAWDGLPLALARGSKLGEGHRLTVPELR